MRKLILFVFILSSSFSFSQEEQDLLSDINYLENNYPDYKWDSIANKLVGHIELSNYYITVNTDILEDLIHETEFKYRSQLLKLYLFNVAQFYIENKSSYNDLDGNLEALKGIIRYYIFLQKKEPSLKSKAVTKYKKLERRSKLKEYVHSPARADMLSGR